MFNNAYLKIILTVIAIELMVLIVKTNSTEKLLVNHAVQQQQQQEVVQAKYTMPNSAGESQPITNVNIASVGGKSVPGVLPAVVANPVNTTGSEKFRFM